MTKSLKTSENSNEKKERYLFINKTIFFPEEKILALGDLHIGYEHMLRNQGIMIPLNQIKQDLKDIQKTVKNLKEKKYSVEKIIILGDLKHHFGFQYNEKFDVRDFLKHLENIKGIKKVILLKGNHERFELDKRKYKEYHLEKGILFIHGDKINEKLFEKKISFIVMGHLHPALLLSDSSGIKSEKFKCFLKGKWKRKETIILPSFFSAIEGTDIRTEDRPIGENRKEFSVIPNEKLKNFQVFLIGKKEVYNFGKLKNIE